MTKEPETIEIRRGDILWIQCDPSFGVEPQKIRTCVVVSNDIAISMDKRLRLFPRKPIQQSVHGAHTWSTYARLDLI